MWANVVEYLVTNVVILNLYFFTYSMMAVWDTLESTSPEDYRRKSKITKIMFSVNVFLHGALVIAAAVQFLFFLPNLGNKGKCEDLSKYGPNIDLRGYLLHLFILQTVVTLCDLFVITLFLRFFRYFAVKKLNSMRRAGA